MYRGRDAILRQHVTHRFRRRNERLDIGALRASEPARHPLANRPRQYRHVVMQVLFEEGVVGGDARHLERLRQFHTCIVRDERCVNVDEVDVLQPIAL